MRHILRAVTTFPFLTVSFEGPPFTVSWFNLSIKCFGEKLSIENIQP